jgi:hypothetical protein
MLRAVMHSVRSWAFVGAPSSRVLLRRHQLSDSRLKNLVLAFVGLCHRLIIFVRRKTGDCHLSILELANQENIAYRQSRKLECFLNTLAFFCFSHGHRLMSASPGSCGQFNAPDRKAGGDGKNPTPFNFSLHVVSRSAFPDAVLLW